MPYEYEWGSLAQGEKYSLEGLVERNSTYNIYFTATGSQPIYAYFDLYSFTDDLDLALYQYSPNFEQYTLIRVSEEEEYEGVDISECGLEAYPEFTSAE